MIAKRCHNGTNGVELNRKTSNSDHSFNLGRTLNCSWAQFNLEWRAVAERQKQAPVDAALYMGVDGRHRHSCTTTSKASLDTLMSRRCNDALWPRLFLWPALLHVPKPLLHCFMQPLLCGRTLFFWPVITHVTLPGITSACQAGPSAQQYSFGNLSSFAAPHYSCCCCHHRPAAAAAAAATAALLLLLPPPPCCCCCCC